MVELLRTEPPKFNPGNQDASLNPEGNPEDADVSDDEEVEEEGDIDVDGDGEWHGGQGDLESDLEKMSLYETEAPWCEELD